MTLLEKWNARQLDNWAQARARGEHDDQCEQRERSSLCHCSKRRREAEGFTTPPDLRFREPTCSRGHDVGHDGDSWRCYPCRTVWPSDVADGEQGEFTDDYAGEPFGGERHGRLLLELLAE